MFFTIANASGIDLIRSGNLTVNLFRMDVKVISGCQGVKGVRCQRCQTQIGGTHIMWHRNLIL